LRPTSGFAAFISSRRVTDNPRGDFIADTQGIIRGGRFPVMRSWPQLETYLLVRHACDEAIQQAHRVWREYERYARTSHPAPGKIKRRAA
jgi:hypothetical protein